MNVHTANKRSVVDPRTRADDHAKTDRLSIRVTAAEKALVERAARANNTSASRFVVEAAVKSAADVLADQTRFALPAEQWAAFTALLDRPARVVPALSGAASRRSPFREP